MKFTLLLLTLAMVASLGQSYYWPMQPMQFYQFFDQDNLADLNDDPFNGDQVEQRSGPHQDGYLDKVQPMWPAVNLVNLFSTF